MSDDPPNDVQIQMDIQSAVDEAVRNIREHALRQVMVMVNGIRPDRKDGGLFMDYELHFNRGHLYAKSQILNEIEAMIAKDAAT